MKYVVHPRQRLRPRRRSGLRRQQDAEIDAGDLGHQMAETDEAAERAVTIEAISKMAVARSTRPEQSPLVPVAARILIEQRPQSVEVEACIGFGVAFAEERPEIAVVRKRAQPRELQLEQREMRLVEIDRIDVRGPRREIG